MSRDAWMDEFVAHARAARDRERLRLDQMHGVAYNYRETDPDHALSLYEEGSRLARKLNEPWWALFYDHWRVTAYLHFKDDYRSHALDLAVGNVLEARKPLYDQFPGRFAVHDDLAAAYLGIDPEGFADDVRALFDYMETEVADSLEDRLLLQARRRGLALDCERLDEALDWAQRSLSLVADRPDDVDAVHHSTFLYSALCRIHHRRRDWESLDESSVLGEQAARKADNRMQLSECLLWQAVAARRAGNEDKARAIFQAATSRASRLRMAPGGGFHDPLCTYLELGGDRKAALASRLRQLELVEGRGQFHYETRCHIHGCRLRALLGELTPQHLTVARASAHRLRFPGRHLAELDKIAAGEIGPNPDT